MRQTIFALLVGGFLLGAAAPQDDAAKKDLDKLQGDWVMQSNERDGKKLPADQVKGFSRTIKGNAYTVLIENEAGVTELNGTFTLDSMAEPKKVDAKTADGSGKGKTMLGIYKLEGDTHTVCLAPSGQPRPMAFDSKQGVLTVWKREGTKRPTKE